MNRRIQVWCAVAGAFAHLVMWAWVVGANFNPLAEANAREVRTLLIADLPVSLLSLAANPHMPELTARVVSLVFGTAWWAILATWVGPPVVKVLARLRRA